jgi:hypothetical protein
MNVLVAAQHIRSAALKPVNERHESFLQSLDRRRGEFGMDSVDRLPAEQKTATSFGPTPAQILLRLEGGSEQQASARWRRQEGHRR